MIATAPAPGGFEKSELQQILKSACAAVGLDCSAARLLRGHTNAVVHLEKEGVVAKVARRGTPIADVERTASFVRWLMQAGFPTAPLHPIDQPIIADGHAITLWKYLPQPEHPVSAAQLAGPLRHLHTLPPSPVVLPTHDPFAEIRRSLAAIACLPADATVFLADYTDRLEEELQAVEFTLPMGVIQGDPQHRNALHTEGGAVLCDWDTVAYGPPAWDLVTVEVHCRRFGHGNDHYQAFAEAYGWDVTNCAGYQTLASVRELQMITTNAKKVPYAPSSLTEVLRRVDGLRQNDKISAWNIL
ncbi:phosphotransferase family protein [Streptomyces sp. NPDC002476]|uniref:phosphotransferase family protein n=1 Tax=Streptomyces sp. NPDC002476 TaxID=3364648 RepID=UPI00367CC317